MLLDCGDTIQGSPLASVYQAARRAGRTSAPEPMMLAMSRVGYDAMVMGNHELDYGLASLGAARASASFPWLSANTRSTGVVPSFAPYLLKVVGGVKVAVIGITTPAIPQWAKEENIAGLTFLDPVESVRRALLKLEAEKPDVILAAVHGGLGRDAETGAARSHELPGENPVWELAERFPQLAAIVYGHSHQREPGRRIGRVLVVQPRSLAMDVARVDLTLERDPRSGRFRLASATSRLLPVTPETKPDPQVLELARPYHEAAERDLDTRVAEARVPLDGARGRFEDSALVDAIHEVQLHYAKAQVSFTALSRDRRRDPARAGHAPRARGALRPRRRALRGRGRRPHGARGARERHPLLPRLARGVVRARARSWTARSPATTTTRPRASSTRSTSPGPSAAASATCAIAARRSETTSRCGSRSAATGRRGPPATRCSAGRRSSTAAGGRSATCLPSTGARAGACPRSPTATGACWPRAA